MESFMDSHDKDVGHIKDMIENVKEMIAEMRREGRENNRLMFDRICDLERFRATMESQTRDIQSGIEDLDKRICEDRREIRSMIDGCRDDFSSFQAKIAKWCGIAVGGSAILAWLFSDGGKVLSLIGKGHP
jgi:archaellum component FlaC